MGFPTKNDDFGVWNGGTTILGHPHIITNRSFVTEILGGRGDGSGSMAADAAHQASIKDSTLVDRPRLFRVNQGLCITGYIGYIREYNHHLGFVFWLFRIYNWFFRAFFFGDVTKYPVMWGLYSARTDRFLTELWKTPYKMAENKWFSQGLFLSPVKMGLVVTLLITAHFVRPYFRNVYLTSAFSMFFCCKRLIITVKHMFKKNRGKFQSIFGHPPEWTTSKLADEKTHPGYLIDIWFLLGKTHFCQPAVE